MRTILHAWARADTERQELQDEVARLIAETVRLGELQVRSRVCDCARVGRQALGR